MNRSTPYNFVLLTALLASCSSENAATSEPVGDDGNAGQSDRPGATEDDDVPADDDTAGDDDATATDDDAPSADDDYGDAPANEDDGDDDIGGDDTGGDDVAVDGDSAADDDLPATDLPSDDSAQADAGTAEPVAPTVNPFVVAAHDPLSTFAVDVDTASYDIFRRDVRNGRLPVQSQVRVEEFVNYFDYDYPMPEADAEEPFSISLAAAPNLLDSGTTLLRVGIQGARFEKRPANLVFLIDTSGSMSSPEKLPLVQQLLSETLDVLDPDDRVSVVTYAGVAGVLLDSTPVSERDTILGVIDSLGAGGSTNGAGGIQAAYAQAEGALLDGGINHVILCTDGDFNVGVSSTDELVDLIERKRKRGVTLTALGFGTANNDPMMEAVSNAGNGTYAVIADEDQAVSYVHQRLLQNLTFIAKDVKIQVEWNPEHVVAYRLLGYENRDIADDDFRNDVVDAGEIGSEHRVTALYEVVLTGSDVPLPEGAPALDDGEAFKGTSEVRAEDLVLVKVRYKSVDAIAEDPAFEVATSLAPSGVAASALDLDLDFQWAMAVATFAEVLRGSPYADAARLDEIAGVIAEQAPRDPERGEFAFLFDEARTLLSEGVDE